MTITEEQRFDLICRFFETDDEVLSYLSMIPPDTFRTFINWQHSS